MEYRDGPYIVFKVVRESRFPAELPVSLARYSREIERGRPPQEIADLARNSILDLQDLRVINETEGRYLLDLFEWFSGARDIEAELEEAADDGTRPEPEQWPMQMRSVSMTVGPDLSLLQLLTRAKTALDRLDERIYQNYSRSPGMWQAECVALRDVTQGLADAYQHLRPLSQQAFEDLQLERFELNRQTDRSEEEDEQLETLQATEVWAQRLIEELPEELDEPRCPALRR